MDVIVSSPFVFNVAVSELSTERKSCSSGSSSVPRIGVAKHSAKDGFNNREKSVCGVAAAEVDEEL